MSWPNYVLTPLPPSASEDNPLSASVKELWNAVNELQQILRGEITVAGEISNLDNVTDRISSNLDCDIGEYRMTGGSTLTSCYHGLGREPTGAIVLFPPGGIEVCRMAYNIHQTTIHVGSTAVSRYGGTGFVASNARGYFFVNESKAKVDTYLNVTQLTLAEPWPGPADGNYYSTTILRWEDDYCILRGPAVITASYDFLTRILWI